MLRVACVSFARFVGHDARSIVRKTSLINHHAIQVPLLPNYGVIRPFHATSQRNVHPIVLVILNKASRVGSMFTGKFLRNWWKLLTPEQKGYYKKKYIFNPWAWAVPIGIIIIGGGIFYYTHLQVTPVTNRKRFIGISESHLMEISDFQLEEQLKEVEGKIVDEKDAVYARIRDIVEKMVKSNQDIEKLKAQKWTIHVIDMDISNAFVLPNGHIFVYTGLLKMVNNDDQLAFILGHEMSHALLGHGAENISYSGIIDFLTTFFMTALWTIVPSNIMTGLATYLQDKLFKMLFELPYNRSLESEADKVGLHMASKACYDVRESSIFWRNWAVIEAMGGAEETPEYLSTHPANEHRAKDLDEQIPEALEKRRACNCPELKKSLTDVNFALLQALIEKTKKKKVPTATLR